MPRQRTKNSYTEVSNSSGKILEDAATLQSYNIENGHTLIAICSAGETKPTASINPQPTVTTITPPTTNTNPNPSQMGNNPFNPFMGMGQGMPGLGGGNILEMMNNPMMQSMMSMVVILQR